MSSVMNWIQGLNAQQGYSDIDTSGSGYSWMPEGAKLAKNESKNRYKYYDPSGFNVGFGGRDRATPESQGKFVSDWVTRTDNKQFKDYYPNYFKEGYAQSNLSKDSLSSRPFQDFVGIERKGNTNQYTYGDYDLSTRNRRIDDNLIYSISDKSGNVVQTYEAPEGKWGDALKWIDNQKQSGGSSDPMPKDSSNIQKALAANDATTQAIAAPTSNTANVDAAVAQTQPAAQAQPVVQAQPTAQTQTPAMNTQTTAQPQRRSLDTNTSTTPASTATPSALDQALQSPAQPDPAAVAAQEAENARIQEALAATDLSNRTDPTADNYVVGTNLATGEYGNTGMNAGLPIAEQELLMETIQDAYQKAGMRGDASLTKESDIGKASEDLAEAQNIVNLDRYRNITDALRGDRLQAARASEGRGNNFADRLMLQAEMSAADRYSQLDNQAYFEDASRKYQAATNRANEQYQIAGDLAETIGSTQERTLPAVKMAELLIEQAIQEGNIEFENAETRREALIESARELLENPNLFDAMADQIAVEGVNMAGEYTANVAEKMQRIQNLKNIPGLVQAILNRVGEDMFAKYTATYGEIAAIWGAAMQAGLVDQDGYTIPENEYALKDVGDSAYSAADDVAGSGNDGIDNAVNSVVDGAASWLDKGLEAITNNVFIREQPDD